MSGYRDYKVRVFQKNENEDLSKLLLDKTRAAINTTDYNVNKVELDNNEEEVQ